MEIKITIPENQIAKMLESSGVETEEMISILADELADEYRAVLAEAIFNKLSNYKLENQEER